jgi:hypothetical protein
MKRATRRDTTARQGPRQGPRQRDRARDRWAGEGRKPQPTKPAIRVTSRVPPHLACVCGPEHDPTAASGLGKRVCESTRVHPPGLDIRRTKCLASPEKCLGSPDRIGP